MEPNLDAILAEIGWNRSTLARRLGVDTSTVDAWAKGKRVDLRIVPWLKRLAAFHAEHQKPEDWTPRAPGRPPQS